MQKLLINIAIIASFALSGCSATGERTANTSSGIGFPSWKIIPNVYRIPIRQGNLITQEMVNGLKPGMTKQQVRYLLGTPLLIDTFQEDRWKYVYASQPSSGEEATTSAEQTRVGLLFENGKLNEITGDLYPEDEESASQTKAKNRERTIVIPANAPRAGEDKTADFLEGIWGAEPDLDDPEAIKTDGTPEQPAEKAR